MRVSGSATGSHNYIFSYQVIFTATFCRHGLDSFFSNIFNFTPSKLDFSTQKANMVLEAGATVRATLTLFHVARL